MFYAIALLCYAVECFIKTCPYIIFWLSSSSGRGRSMDDQLLDLALMTNYSQSTFTWTVASSLSVFAQIQYCPG